MSATMTMEPPRDSSIYQLNRLRAVYRQRGWTVWHGSATDQYWAAHTKQMVLLSGDSARDLEAKIERLEENSRPAATAFSHMVQARRTGAVRLPPRPRPRGSWHRRGATAGKR